MPYAIPTVTAAAVVATAGTLTYAALSAQSQLFGPTLIAPTKPNEIALTYDDGPNPAATPQLLEVLALAARHGGLHGQRIAPPAQSGSRPCDSEAQARLPSFSEKGCGS